MKKLKNMFAVALVLCLMAGILPMAAFADNEDGEDAGRYVAEAVSDPVENGGSEKAADGAGGDQEGNGTDDKDAGAGEPADHAEADDAARAETTAVSGAPRAPEAFAGSAPEAPVPPVEPDLTGLSDKEANDRIRLYNEEVERYNEAVEQYNADFDAYEAAVTEYNASVESFNEHAAIYNAAVEEHNQAEQEKLDAYEAAMEDFHEKARPYVDYQMKIDAVSDRNLAGAESQMESLGDIFRADKENIRMLGTILEEDYTVNYGRRTSTLGHAGDLVISWDDLAAGNDHSTIRIQEGEPSEETYKVANLHIFEDFANFSEMSDYQSELGWDCMNINVDDENGVIIIPKALIDRIAMIEIEVAEVGRNDTVTVVGQNSIFASTYVTTVGRFFEGYTDGPYWYSAGTVFQSTAMESESDWTGTSHTFSYSSGTTDRAGIKNPLNVNYYVFQRYSNPYTMPEKPEDVRAEMMDKAEILPFAELPGSRLSRLLGLTEREIRAETNPAPVVAEVPAAPVVMVIPDEDAPLAAPGREAEEPAALPVAVSIASGNMGRELVAQTHYAVNEEIADGEIPLASGASWALVNLIAGLLTVLAAMAGLVSRREKEEGSEKRETRVNLGLVIPAAASVILFVLTEDLHDPMALVDIWTPAMLALLAVNGLLCLYAARGNGRKKSKV